MLQGHGNSNNENISRRFFEIFEKSAEILQLNQRLLEQLKNFLNKINSKVAIESHLKLCCEANDRIIKEYPSWKLSSTVHKVLVHSTYAIKKIWANWYV